MNKIKPIFFALVCAFFLFGCNSTVEQTKSPTETLKALSEASKKKDTGGDQKLSFKGNSGFASTIRDSSGKDD